MKIILSRKGVDSAYGGFPSPILPDDTPLSITIPAAFAPVSYGELRGPDGSLGPLVEHLSRGRLSHRTPAHLDPDINPLALPRRPGWRPLFGQVGAARSHLMRQGVGPGDLFLFFGWFRRTEIAGGMLRYATGAPNLHLIFGWLQVGEIWEVKKGFEPPTWARYHPHFQPQFRRRRSRGNCVYVAAERLNLPGACDLPGGGVFPRFHKSLRLSAPERSRSIWKLPEWFHPEGRESALTYNADPRRWTPAGDHVLLRSAAQGQEFVLDTEHYPEATPWTTEIVAQACL